MYYPPHHGRVGRGLWLLDTAGRGLTVATLIGFSGFVATVVVVIVRGVSTLDAWPWLFILGVGLGLGVLTIGAVAVASVVGGKLVMAQGTDRTVASNTERHLNLQATLLVTNTDPDHVLQPARVELRKLVIDGSSQRVRDEGHIFPLEGTTGRAAPGQTLPFSMVFNVTSLSSTAGARKSQGLGGRSVQPCAQGDRSVLPTSMAGPAAG